MAFSDTLNQFTGKGPSKGNRVAALLSQITDTEDRQVLVDALCNESIKHIAITRALRAEYGNDAVTDTSVREYRTRMMVDGL